MTDREPGSGSERAEDYRRDLHAEARAGESTAEAAAGGEPVRTLADIQEAREKLRGFSREALQRVPVVPEGEWLRQGATYIDLRANSPSEFTATAEMRATRDHWYVPKSETDYQLWNGLTGVTDPERPGQPPRRGI